MCDDVVREIVHNLSKPVAENGKRNNYAEFGEQPIQFKKRKIKYLKVEHSFNPGRNNKVT